MQNDAGNGAINPTFFNCLLFATKFTSITCNNRILYTFCQMKVGFLDQV